MKRPMLFRRPTFYFRPCSVIALPPACFGRGNGLALGIWHMSLRRANLEQNATILLYWATLGLILQYPSVGVQQLPYTGSSRSYKRPRFIEAISRQWQLLLVETIKHACST